MSSSATISLRKIVNCWRLGPMPKPGKCAAEEVQTSGAEQLEASEQGGEAKMEQTKSLRSGAQALSVYGVPSSSYHA